MGITWKQERVITVRYEFTISTEREKDAKDLNQFMSIVEQSIQKNHPDRMKYDDAYHWKTEEGQLVLYYEVETVREQIPL